eukprot:3814013-Amphidinium_carterae.1
MSHKGTCNTKLPSTVTVPAPYSAHSPTPGEQTSRLPFNLEPGALQQDILLTRTSSRQAPLTSTAPFRLLCLVMSRLTGHLTSLLVTVAASLKRCNEVKCTCTDFSP